MHKFTPAQKSYLTQYISLMLIILSCLIGAANGKQKDKVEEVPQATQPAGVVAEVNPSYLKSEIILKNIFNQETGSINAEELEPLKEIIENHDLDLELKVIASDRVGAKVAQLSRILREQGFLKDSFAVSGSRIAVVPNSNVEVAPTTVTARFEREQS